MLRILATHDLMVEEISARRYHGGAGFHGIKSKRETKLLAAY
jgi:hypothetical protein